jgi:hypothetical protein
MFSAIRSRLFTLFIVALVALAALALQLDLLGPSAAEAAVQDTPRITTQQTVGRCVLFPITVRSRACAAD